LFARPYASDPPGIEEEIIFSTFDENEEDDNEEVLLEIEPCIPFATQLFPIMMAFSCKLCVNLNHHQWR